MIPYVTLKEQRRRKIVKIIITAFPVLLIIIAVNMCFLCGFIPSNSMSPTVESTDFILVNKLTYLTRDIQRGDVVIFVRNGNFYMKRVIGVGGDEINLRDGSLYVNGYLAEEEYVIGSTDIGTNGMSDFSVPEGYLFVLGDNRDVGSDSRSYESPYISEKRVQGLCFGAIGKSGIKSIDTTMEIVNEDS